MLPATRCPNNLRGHPLPCPRLGTEGKCSVNTARAVTTEGAGLLTTTPGPWRSSPRTPAAPGQAAPGSEHASAPGSHAPATQTCITSLFQQTGVQRVWTASPSQFDSCEGQVDTGMGPPRPRAPHRTQVRAGVRRRSSTRWGLRVPARRGRSRGSTAPCRGSPPPAALLWRRRGRNSRGGRPSAGPVLQAPGSATMISN